MSYIEDDWSESTRIADDGTMIGPSRLQDRIGPSRLRQEIIIANGMKIINVPYSGATESSAPRIADDGLMERR